MPRSAKRKESPFQGITGTQKLVIKNFSFPAQAKILTKIKEGFDISTYNEKMVELKKGNSFYIVGLEGNMDKL